LCEIYQITEIGIFGSYARGEETEASDIDILVDYETARVSVSKFVALDSDKKLKS
jgi:predicted nucleotidyltransferase